MKQRMSSCGAGIIGYTSYIIYKRDKRSFMTVATTDGSLASIHFSHHLSLSHGVHLRPLRTFLIPPAKRAHRASWSQTATTVPLHLVLRPADLDVDQGRSRHIPIHVSLFLTSLLRTPRYLASCWWIRASWANTGDGDRRWWWRQKCSGLWHLNWRGDVDLPVC